ncbi:MAG TPA: hypothetical protein VLL48_01435, partial [Longimicrobiales bacterium]|nr:hypothetical protein [Longimicrobiales bacterium]
MFVDLMDEIRSTVTNLVFRAQIGEPRMRPRPAAAEREQLQYTAPDESPDTGVRAPAGGGGDGRGGGVAAGAGVAAGGGGGSGGGGLGGMFGGGGGQQRDVSR